MAGDTQTGKEKNVIQFGVCEWCLDKRGVAAIARTAELGLTSIQLEVGGEDPLRELSSATTQAAYLAAGKQHGVTIVGLALNTLAAFGGFLSPEGTAERTKTIDLMLKSLDVAKAMGMSMMHVPSFGRAEIKTTADLQLTADMMRRACVAAEGSRVVIASENPFAAGRNDELVKLVDHPQFRILVDTCNPVMHGYDCVELIEKLAPHIANQVHVKDARKGVKGSVGLGMGDGKFAAAARALKGIGFDGYVILENHYEQNAKALVAYDLGVLKSSFKQ